MNKPPVIIVGAGLAGLACARRLAQDGIPFQLLEAGDGVGGRVRTDVVDGFRLDRGFQVLLTAYPECRRQLDYASLNLREFIPGAMIFCHGKFHEVTDPWRHPWAGLRGVFSPVGSLSDKIKVGTLRRHVQSGSLEDLWQHKEQTTLSYLQARGFSGEMIERFFRPFMGGIFLEKELRTSSLMFEFVFRMLAQGATALPAEGMEAIARQLARTVPDSSLQLNTRVVALNNGSVTTSCGRTIVGSPIVLAVEGPAASVLLGENQGVGSRKVHCLYYAAGKPPMNKPVLMLDGEGRGPVNNAAVVSAVAPSYAPSGQTLISLTVLEADVPSGEPLEEAGMRQMRTWFGDEVERWHHLRTYSVQHAQPEQGGKLRDRLLTSPEVRPGVFRCGDYTNVVSLHGALESGLKAAQAVIAARSG